MAPMFAQIKYKKYFLRGKGDPCEGLKNLTPFCATALKSKNPGILCVCYIFGLINLV